ncbi:MAG: hypothetical protein AMK71_04875, partial [Nitrospira bacterium SG8_35_4]
MNMSMLQNGLKRVIIENLKPQIEGGRFPVKRAVGEKVVVTVDIFSDGHDSVSARVLFKGPNDADWRDSPLLFAGNDRWVGEFSVRDMGMYHYTAEGWVDHFRTWQKDLKKKYEAGQDIRVDLQIGTEFIREGLTRAKSKDAKRLEEIADELGTADIDHAVMTALGQELTELMTLHRDLSFATRYEKELVVAVDRKKAVFSAWYER